MFFTYFFPIEENQVEIDNFPENLSYFVIIQADSLKEADKIAESKGIKLKGPFSEAGELWALCVPGYHYNFPNIYGYDIEDYQPNFCEESGRYAIVYYKDGKKVEYYISE